MGSDSIEERDNYVSGLFGLEIIIVLIHLPSPNKPSLFYGLHNVFETRHLHILITTVGEGGRERKTNRGRETERREG